MLGALLSGLGAQLWAPGATAAELRGEARVVDVVALSGGAVERDCHPPKPRGGALTELLAWDLRVDCAAGAAAVTGYRVFYRWDGHTYSRVMSRHPGVTVPVRVRVH
jgi:hypothetical protein